MSHIVIVGSGLFGSVIRDALRLDGHVVTVIDDDRAHSGSKPAACLMKPSWFSSLGKDIYDPALELLNELYGVEEMRFRLGPTKVGGVFWVPPKKILRDGSDIYGTVRHVKDSHVVYTPPKPDGLIQLAHDYCVVAAGVWSNELVYVGGLRGQAGAAFTWNTPECFEMEPFIRPWAPYRQLVAFMRDERELWVGDGTAIKPENWTKERQWTSQERCQKAVEVLSPPDNILYGIRPYVRGAKPALLDQRSAKIWVATGGAKNGTLAAAWCANQLRKRFT